MWSSFVKWKPYIFKKLKIQAITYHSLFIMKINTKSFHYAISQYVREYQSIVTPLATPLAIVLLNLNINYYIICTYMYM